MSDKVLLNTDLKELKFIKKGKVRDIYEVDEYYLIISTDRLSAFDVIMKQGIPNKGKVLNKISEFWFNKTKHIINNHLVTTKVDEFPKIARQYADILEGRSMLVKKAELIPLECIVRGYISGSGWKDYKKTGGISGIQLPAGLVESEKLPEPIFTPSTKAEIGEHDENISPQKAAEIIGSKIFDILNSAVLGIYKSASEYALLKGIIIADTKMEFGMFNGEIILIDELLTPDSSRFWPKGKYLKGAAVDSFDKQYVRDYLESIKFNKMPPPPDLPVEVIMNTALKYQEALQILTGEKNLTMKPLKINVSGSEFLIVVWADNTKSKIRLMDLRKYCPCAICGENREHHKDWSHVFYTADELKVVSIQVVGQYAISIVWADGHNTGIYEFDLLKKMNCGEAD